MKRRFNLFIIPLCLCFLVLFAWARVSPAGAKAAAPAITPTPTPITCPNSVSLRLAADYWIAQNPNSPDSTWFNAIFIKGLIETYRQTHDAKYLNYATSWAKHNNW